MVLILRIFDRELQLPTRLQRLIFSSRHLITNGLAHAASGPVARDVATLCYGLMTASTIADEVRSVSAGVVEVEDQVEDHLGYQAANVGAMFASFSRVQTALDGGFGGDLRGGSLGERVRVALDGGAGPALGGRGAIRGTVHLGRAARRVHGFGRGGRGGRMGGNGPVGF